MIDENNKNRADTMGSFRDPDGRVLLQANGPVFRQLTPTGSLRAQDIARLAAIQTLQARHQFIEAESVGTNPACLRHPRIFFPSYAHEWSATMLHRAAAHTLAFNQALLDEGWELKDATPTNILFEGTRPVFVDFLSPDHREPAQLGWRAYGQFTRTFLIPMLLYRIRRIPLRWMFLAHRDGVPPELAHPMLGGLGRFNPKVFGLVTLPVWMGRWAGRHPPTGLPSATSPELAQTITRRILKGLGERLKGLQPEPPAASLWSDYQDQGTSYSSEGLAAKEQFISEALETCRPTTVLDLGCNTGKYSKMAARSGARVVALDFDPECVERIFLEAESEGLDIQPLVVDLGRPAPRLGWAYKEEFSLLDRLEKRFEMTFALALVHHLLVRERVPMGDIATFLAHTTTKNLLVEWIPPQDPQFQRLSGPNQCLYTTCSIDGFLDALGVWFKVLSITDVPGCERRLILLEKLVVPE